MDMITISAKTLDEAITKALLELRTTSDHLYYEIVQKESFGFLGIFGGKPCVIRARVMEEEEERRLKKQKAEKEKAEKAEAAKKASEKAKEESKKERQEKTAGKAFDTVKTKPQPEEKPLENRNVPGKDNMAEKVGNIEAPGSTEKGGIADRNENKDRIGIGEKPVTAERNSERPPKRNYEKDYNRKKYDKKEFSRYDNKEKHIGEIRPEKEPRVRQEVKMDEELVQRKAKEFLEQVFRSMGIEVSIETLINKEDGELQVIMTGKDMGILIGKRGQTLDSLQYLVSLVVNKETEGYLRVKLDTENYRERRKETLEVLAKNISYKVKRTKRPVALEPMNPYERRIIHSALQNDRYVVTRSEGEDPYRHVVITLKRESYNGRRDRYPSHRDNRNRDNREGRASEKAAERAAEKALQRPEV